MHEDGRMHAQHPTTTDSQRRTAARWRRGRVAGTGATAMAGLSGATVAAAIAAVAAMAVATSATATPLGLPVRFDAEIVRLAVGGDTLEVEGIYRLLFDRRGAGRSGNDSSGHSGGGRVTLFYPYPADSLLGHAATVLLETRAPRGAWAAARFEELGGAASSGARWFLEPSTTSDTLEVRTVYRQALLARYARYIVTTTRAWGEPLSSARFEIRLPAGAVPLRFSFPFAREASARGDVYVYEARGFMPDHDIIVEWERVEDPPR